MARSKFSMDRMEATDAGQWQLKNDKVFASYSQVPAGDTIANLAGFPDRDSIWMPRTHFMPEVDVDSIFCPVSPLASLLIF